VTDAVGQLAAFIRERKSDPCPGLLVVGLEFAEPRLHTGKQVRLVAMGTTERSDVTRQGGEALRVQINAGVDLVSGCWANKSQRRHHKPSMPRSSHSGMAKKRSPDRGKPGLLLVPLGGNVCGESSPHERPLIRLMRSVQILFPYDVHKKKLFCPTTAPAVGKKINCLFGSARHEYAYLERGHAKDRHDGAPIDDDDAEEQRIFAVERCARHCAPVSTTHVQQGSREVRGALPSGLSTTFNKSPN
jgi:hypothetical protein